MNSDIQLEQWNILINIKRTENLKEKRRKDKVTRQRTVYPTNALCARKEKMNQLSIEQYLQWPLLT